MSEKISGLYERYCRECGTKFYTGGNRKILCDGCQKLKRKESIKRNNEAVKKPKVVAHYRPAADVGLFKIVRIIDRYNAEHGTHHSYGKFMELVRTKRINLRQEVLNCEGLSTEKE